MGYYPTSVKVEVDFANPALSKVETWTDISQWVTGQVRFEWGRSSALDDYQPGKGSFTLINDDGRFDPSNTTGPYYGNLKPRRRVRVTTTVATFFRPIAYGWIEGWPQRWEGRKTCYVDITFVDGLSVLSGVQMPESVWDWRVKKTNPLLWYKLGDTNTPWAVDSSGNNLGGEWRVFEGVGAPITGLEMPKAVLDAGKVASIIPSTDRQAVSWASLQSDVGQPLGGIVGTPRTPVFVPAWETQYMPTSPSGFGAVMWILYRQAFPVDIRNIYSSTTPMVQPLITWGQIGSLWWEFYLTESAQIGFQLSIGAASYGLFPIGSSLDDGQPHMLAFAKSLDAITVYIDGVSKVSIYVGDHKPYPLTPAAVGVATPYFSGLQSTVGDVLFWDRTLLAAEISLLWYAGRYGSTIASSAAITTSSAFNQGFQLADLDNDLYYSTMFSGGQIVTPTISGQSFTDYLRRLAATEQGLLFWHRTGDMIFYGRDWPVGNESATVQFTLGDHSGATLGYAALDYRDWADELENDVTVNFPAGAERALNQASIDAYGQVAGSVDTFIDNAAVAKQVANLRAWKYGTAPADGIVPDRLVIQPNTEAEFAMVSSLNMAHRLQITRTRPNGTQLVDDYWVESIAHDFAAGSGGEWTTVVGLSPADHPAKPFVLDSSLLNSDHVLWI